MVTLLYVGCGPGTDYPQMDIFLCMLERIDSITNKVLEPITFVLAYPSVLCYERTGVCSTFSSWNTTYITQVKASSKPVALLKWLPT
jgi:hypothetical protein